MAINWYIVGESGKAWDDAPATLAARNISSAKVNFKSLEADEFTFNVLVEDIRNEVYAATPVISPDSSIQSGSTVAVTVSSATTGASLHYTTDGNNPTIFSPTVANGGTLTVAVPSILKVVAIKSGIFNSDINVAEYRLKGVEATGGTTSDSGGFRTHTFLSGGNLVVTNGGSIQYLVVAGGGSGGGNTKTKSGGGGGAGGFKTGTINITPGTYTISVGAGGMALSPQTAASDGGGSSIGSLVTCIGGGAGASASGAAVVGRAGGSGGGGSSGGIGGAGTAGQGNSGGNSSSTSSGLGGGSSSAGTNVGAVTADGGNGTSSSLTGVAVTYSVGGGVRDPNATTNKVDSSVIPNTGRGGAGVFKKATVRIGANGSSGIVVIKYALVEVSRPDNIPSTGSNLPNLRQYITLYRDSVRFFTGHVTNIRSIITNNSQEHQVTVSGPWWFLEKVPLTSIKTDGSGKVGERISYVLGTDSGGGDLRTNIMLVIDRSVQEGCPISPSTASGGGSTVAAMTRFPRISLNQSTCGQALSELVRLCPDAMTYFDYSVYPPTIHVVRRPTCESVTFDQESSPITSIDINPIIELEVKQVSLPSVSRNTVGKTVFNLQESGSDQSGANITRRQIITISGQELDTFLPNDLFDSQTITTSNNITYLAHNSDSACVNAANKAGLAMLPVNVYYDRFTTVNSRQRAGATPIGIGSTRTSTFGLGGYSIKDKSGNTLSGYSIITSGTPANYGGVTTVNVTVSGFMWIERTIDTGDGTPDSPYPAYLKEAGFTYIDGGYTCEQSSCDRVAYYQKAFSFSAVATPGGSGSTTVYKPADYTFINPPAGLSNFLKSAQDWIPYEGSIVLEQQDVGAVRYRGKKINIINSLSSFSSMGALVSSESLEIETGQTTISLGAPPRNDYRTLVDKIRKTSQDNIVYL